MTGIGGDCFCLVAKPEHRSGATTARAARRGGTPRTAGGARRRRLAFGAFGHRARRRRGMVCGSRGAWPLRSRSRARPGDPLCRAGFPVAPRVALDWALAAPALAADPGASRHYLVDGARARDRRRHAVSGARRDAACDRGWWAEGVLRGGGGRHRGDARAARLVSRRRGFRTPPRRGPSRRSRPTIVASMSSNCRPTARAWSRSCCSTSSNISTSPRSIRTGRSACISRWRRRGSPIAVRDAHVADPNIHARSRCRRLIDKGFAGRLAGRIDRGRRVKLAGRADAVQRHRLPDRGRSRPHGGVDHQFALWRIRMLHRDREDRHHAAQSRRLLCCSIPAIPTASGRRSGQ